MCVTLWFEWSKTVNDLLPTSSIDTYMYRYGKALERCSIEADSIVNLDLGKIGSLN